MDLTGIMMDIFGPYGAVGVFLMVLCAFILDATVVPALPEVFIIVGFSYNPTPGFAVILIIAAILGECIGNIILYTIVEKVGLPKKIKSVMNKYVGILFLSDERMMLVNRIAPVIPYSGAFISVIETWTLPRALFYIALGCIIKYGLILSMSTFFYQYFTSDVAQTLMIVFVFVIIGISLILSYIRKKKMFSNEAEVKE